MENLVEKIYEELNKVAPERVSTTLTPRLDHNVIEVVAKDDVKKPPTFTGIFGVVSKELVENCNGKHIQSDK